MDVGVISVRYARALLKNAVIEKQEGIVYQNMQCLMECYLHVPDLRLTIDNPMLSKDKKQEVIKAACGKNVCESTERFISLVLKESREAALLFMAASYITLYRKHKNIICGKLTTASAVNTIIENRMKQLVEKYTQGSVEFNTEIDPDILGGFVLEYDTYRMDASVKTQLRRILTELKNN
ncbi:F0F1 ATP synthase subunit delta [Prevotella sp. oral taxon 475]|jgi:ATP synthase F1, delta subunit|uniref:F0F1 ATP synthase subunit delta n=1 Tax=Prevotella sp. oral taxon 475 TaxID=712471 RepID=UPI001BABCFAE|nr:F0F1 ATP synthase subunit delta [Prevotella sp. oral taxon 475]QUB46549.1 F0F1 ATP synthase subunit delta [Prevotella sp. oral taxon 475]